MSWMIAGTALATAAVGAVSANQQRKAQQKANQQNANISAAQTQYSPWTGVNPQAANIQPVTGSELGGAVQGGLGGAMFGAQMKKGMADPDFADKNFEDSVQLDSAGPKPISPTTVPADAKFDLEDELRKQQEQQFFGRGPARRSAWG